MAASGVLKRLKRLPLSDSVQQSPAYRTTRVSTTSDVARNTFPEGVKPFKAFPRGMNPLCYLSELTQARGIKYPEYSLLDFKYEPWGWFFQVEITMGRLTTDESGPTKKAAKKNAAAKMLTLLNYGVPQCKPFLKDQDVPLSQVSCFYYTSY